MSPTAIKTDIQTWFLNSLVTTKATSEETRGAYSLTEHLMTAAANPPRHLHRDEDEAYYVLEGEIEYEIDGDVILTGPGSYGVVPKGSPHLFRVLSPTARVLVIGSASGHSDELPGGGVEGFFRAAGVPAERPELPPPTAPDPVALTATADAHGITIFPPT